MGIYYFAVDYNARKQIWAPQDYSIKFPGIFAPENPFSSIVLMMNLIHCYDFVIVNDVSTYSEHEFEDISEKAYEEYKKLFHIEDHVVNLKEEEE